METIYKIKSREGSYYGWTDDYYEAHAICTEACERFPEEHWYVSW